MASEQNFADFRGFSNPPKTLAEKVKQAKIYFPYDLIFVHRDAENNKNETINIRKNEIKEAIGEVEYEKSVCVVPVKMMETWLLINEMSIKKAAGNRNYKENLKLPTLKKLDEEKYPKNLLHKLLKEASGLKGRRLSTFNPDFAVHLVAEYIEDYSPLRQLAAFNAFEQDFKQKIDKLLSDK
jgi:hypothetical protein